GVVGARLLHARVVTHGPVDAQVAQAPIDIQVRADAEVRTPVAGCPAGVLLDRSLGFIVALVLKVVDVGGLPVNHDLAEGELRQAVLDAQVVTCGFLVTTVDQGTGNVDHLVDGAAFGTAAEAVTRRSHAQHVALVEDRGHRLGGDHVVDADLPPVQADVQALHEVRAVDQAGSPGLGGFRLQFRVGTRLEGAVGLGARAGRLCATGGDLAEVRRNATCAAGRGNR